MYDFTNRQTKPEFDHTRKDFGSFLLYNFRLFFLVCKLEESELATRSKMPGDREFMTVCGAR